MNDLGSLLVFLAVMTLLSLMDAINRRARQRRAEELDLPDAEGTPRTAHRGEPKPAARDLQLPTAVEDEWTGEKRTVEERVVEERTVGPRPAAEEPPAPPLLAAAEELREKGRRQLRQRPPVPAVVPAPVAAPPPSGARPRRAVPAARLGVELSGDPAALRRVVLYREILGPPLGSRRGPGGWEDPE